jgi:hypothetical protein
LSRNYDSDARQLELRVAAEIKSKFGTIIDLDKNPLVIIEIIRTFRNFDGRAPDAGDDDDNGVGGQGGFQDSTVASSGGVSPGTGQGPDIDPAPDEITNIDLMQEILKLGKTLKQILNKLETR